ncbi:hypothetical protein [Desulfobacula sp.]|uniref:hypothetical protein n=1 Tax=Desulfobacula sp. TaxID=2593537 RepID=UPI0025C40342|nr:hypothetical protein [Desulfobacula sp.]MBC2703855.1 hypothetical protein [Desulfobacula sp.]
MADTKNMKTIAIIPFETNSQEDISYITSGVLNMLRSRLSWKGNVAVVKTGIVTKELSGITESSESETIIKLGGKTTADYVITGIVTQFSGAYSIDTKVYNLKEKSFLTFYGQSKTIDKIISQIDIIAAKINKKMFDRTTVSYEKFKKEKIITEEDLRRMNPERMMPTRPTGEDEEKPWWKIW